MSSRISSDASEPSQFVFAADLGGTHLRAASVDDKGSIHFRLKQDTPRADSAVEIVRSLVAAARECKKQTTASAVHSCDFKAVSVVVPGTVNVEKGMVVTAPNLRCLDGFPLTSALTDELRRPAILENDANAAAVGEMWRGAGRGHSTICLLYTS